MTTVENKKYISDIISPLEIDNWCNGETVLISAGCGAGKSYFIKNILYAKAKQQNKKILMLIHRTNCVNQFQMEIEKDNKTDVIDIKTYQSVEFQIIKNESYSFSDYSYIVSDEFHYFVEDSGFNGYTDISFNAIMCCNTAVKIFMSATGDTLLPLINKCISPKSKLYTYDTLPDYSHLCSLSFFYQNDTIKSIAYKLKKTGEKAIFFIQSVKDAYRLYREFADNSLFLCGKSSTSGSEYYKYVDEAKIEKMLINQRFEEQFLITTSCFDAGANIIDADLHTVIIDMKNVSSLIQCLGRKRSTGKDDKLNVFIKAVSNRQLGGLRTKRVESLKRAGFLINYGTRKYVEEYPRNDNFSKFYTSAIYDEPMSKRNKNTCTKKVNMMIYEKHKLDIMQCDDIKRLGYAQYIANILRFGNGFGRYYRFYEEGNLRDFLEMLASNRTVMLSRADRNPLIDKIGAKQNGKLIKSLKSLNSILEEKGYKYRIESFKTSRIVDGVKKNYKSAWKVIKLE